MYFTGFACTSCDATYGPKEDLLLCPKCSNLLEATYNLDAMKRELDRDALRRRSGGVWAWQDFLPIVDADAIVSLGEGGTPMLRCDRLARLVGVRELWVKSDAANPTGSLKDRSITVSATKAVEFGYHVLSCDSTGNKASSVAAYAARAGLASVVFCPEDTPVPKVMQSLFFGAKVIRVRGHYAQINAMYRRLIHSGRLKWYDCGTDNPYRYEGKKTYAYEIARDLSWQLPDRVIHPANGGMSIAKAWKGFRELHRLGWIDRLPKMSGVQAAACDPIVRSWLARDSTVAPIEKNPTVAGALAGADPGMLGARALDAIYNSGGAMVGVEDPEIFEAMKLLALEGLFIEPSGAVPIAGLRRLVAGGQVDPGERVVCVVTGSGFKDSDRIAEQVEIPIDVVEGYQAMLAAAEQVG
ncbi:threonine synthase [Bradyrhizobium sp. NP1]|uniref:threonine synthase n=1 Tax=Bradyrhizobium sp. NP1 TaxID=3049772 RepID=UPI0025A5C7B8|nr:threonine synthase [Bradyrhizobium sp. NP1]WJR79246.1 threonine synthase [Bradyrhizobium sp. NP1]